MLLTQKISLTAQEVKDIIRLYIEQSGFEVVGDLEIGIDYTTEKIGKGRFDAFHRKAVIGTTVVSVQPKETEAEDKPEQK